jgi:murein DD-endopeptidase MepM/ murein hydrolase activator NlpD
VVVVAAGAGRVVFAGELAGRGVISVEHEGGLRTTYEPVTASVAAGSPVAAGQPIGTLQAGHPGCAPASCLHWGARLPDGTYLDPLALLRPWAVRLWPWDG